MASKTVKKKTIEFKFSEKHKEYIRKCHECSYNVAEGAVRAGKTVDNIFAFAHELKATPDRIHLATGSTVGNAKLNIGTVMVWVGVDFPAVNATGANTKTMRLYLSRDHRRAGNRR